MYNPVVKVIFTNQHKLQFKTECLWEEIFIDNPELKPYENGMAEFMKSFGFTYIMQDVVAEVVA